MPGWQLKNALGSRRKRSSGGDMSEYRIQGMTGAWEIVIDLDGNTKNK
jgi:hypothetical protein